MPIIEKSTYKAPLLFKNRHIQTIFPSRFRKVTDVRYTRRRISTPDDDFIDLDQSLKGGENAVIVVHGLGGHSYRAYMLGMIKAFNKTGWDGIAVNLTSCSGEPNRLLRFYHSGSSDDLDTVVNYVCANYSYRNIALIGFSLGGNLVLKYLGEKGDSVSPLLRGAAVFSVPCDLATSVDLLDSPVNAIYRKRFLRILHSGIKAKMAIMPDRLNDDDFASIRTLREYDNRYTAPIHGFENAADYYRKCSCKPFIPRVTIPALMINARNDPFLSEACYPKEEARDNKHFFLDIPNSGGHVGFVSFNRNGEYWHETQAVSFITLRK